MTKKQAKQVTVELVGTEAERLAEGITRWSVKCDERCAMVLHWHSETERMYRGDGAWYLVSTPDGSADVFGRDFGAALAAARRLLGVRS